MSRGTAIRDGVSIAMATYNGARYLDEQLESLVRQTVLPAELVVADDGSTDATLDRIEQFARRAPFPVRILDPAPHGGYVETFLRAARHSEGAYIAYSDQDDVWKPDKLAHCLEYLRRPRVMLVVHAGLTVTNALESLGGHFPAIRRTAILPPGSVDDGPLSTFPLGFALVLRREVAEAVLPRLTGYPPEFARPFGHEMPMVWTARGLGRVAFLNEELVLYRRHEANVTSGKGIIPRNGLDILRQGASEYRGFARHARLQAGCLTFLAAAGPAEPADFYRRLARIRDTLSRHFEERAALYESPPGPKRLLAVGRLVARGAYGSRRRGALGLRSLGKDVVTGIRRSPFAGRPRAPLH